MNGNLVGAMMLAYLRGEKDLLKEKERIAQVRKQAETSGMAYWLSNAQKRRVERFWQVVSLLEENSRMSLTDMSRRLKVPISTLFDCMEEVEKYFQFTVMVKDEQRGILATNAPVTFEFAYEISENMEKRKEVPLTVYAEQ